MSRYTIDKTKRNQSYKLLQSSRSLDPHGFFFFGKWVLLINVAERSRIHAMFDPHGLWSSSQAWRVSNYVCWIGNVFSEYIASLIGPPNCVFLWSNKSHYIHYVITAILMDGGPIKNIIEHCVMAIVTILIYGGVSAGFRTLIWKWIVDMPTCSCHLVEG